MEVLQRVRVEMQKKVNVHELFVEACRISKGRFEGRFFLKIVKGLKNIHKAPLKMSFKDTSLGS